MHMHAANQMESAFFLFAWCGPVVVKAAVVGVLTAVREWKENKCGQHAAQCYKMKGGQVDYRWRVAKSGQHAAQCYKMKGGKVWSACCTVL